MSRFLAVAFVLAAACGGKSTPATSTIEHADHMGQGHDEHGAMPPEVVAFHDRLAPLWHAAPGPERTTGACDAMGDFNQLIANLEKAPAPPTVESALWSERVAGLHTALSEFGIDCVEHDAAGFDAKFETMHNAFHALIDTLPHEEHGAAKPDGHEHGAP